MKTKLAKGILLILSLLCILCVPVTPVYAVQQGTDGSELQVVKAEQLEIQFGTAWSGVEFQLKTDAGVYPGAVKVGTDGVLRLEIGGSSRYILTCMNSSTSIPEPEDTADSTDRTQAPATTEQNSESNEKPNPPFRHCISSFCRRYGHCNRHSDRHAGSQEKA